MAEVLNGPMPIEPGGMVAHCEDRPTAALYVPLAHTRQTDCAGWVWYMPVGQADELPPRHAAPGKHGRIEDTAAAAGSGEKYPGGMAEHGEERPDSLL